MNIFKKLIAKLFCNKKDNIKRIEAPKKELLTSNDFKESIKVKIVDADKFNNFEILKCEGNGSGISGTIKF